MLADCLMLWWSLFKATNTTHMYSNYGQKICDIQTHNVTPWRVRVSKDNYSPNIGATKSRRMRWAVNVASMVERRGVYGTLVGRPEERRPLGRPRRRWEHYITMDLQEVAGGTWTGLIRLSIQTGGGRLWKRWWNFGFHKMGGISWLAGNRLASQEGRCPMQ